MSDHPADVDVTVDPADAASDVTKPAPRLFRTIWRWHFYAGLLVIPFIVLLSLSGIVYLFKPQIDAIAWSDLREVTPRAASMSYEQQAAAVTSAYPGATIGSLSPPPERDRASEFDITTKAGDGLRVYVDPYTSTINGDRDPKDSFTTLALELHGMLLFNRVSDDPEGKWGDRILELVASWSIVLVVTGLYLWWPRRRRDGTRPTLRAALTPRMNARSRRLRWRDMHAVTGVLFGFVTLFLLVTGMIWTGVWGTKFGEFTTKAGLSYPEGTWDSATSTTIADLTTGKGNKPAWSTADLPVLKSKPLEKKDGAGAGIILPLAGGSGPLGSSPKHAGHDHTHSAADPGEAGKRRAATLAGVSSARPDVSIRPRGDGSVRLLWDPAKGTPIDAVVGRASELGFASGYLISYPADKTGSFMVQRFPDQDAKASGKASDTRITSVDQFTGEVLRDTRAQDFGAAARVADFGVSLHQGREWGWTSQIMMLIATLALLFSCASAIVMWRKRNPKGLGAPRKAPNRRLGFGVLAITLALGVFFPLLGISIVVLLAFDFLVVRRIRPLARALGAN